MAVISKNIRKYLQLISKNIRKYLQLISTNVREYLPLMSTNIRKCLPLMSINIRTCLPLKSINIRKCLPLMSTNIRRCLPLISINIRRCLLLISINIRNMVPAAFGSAGCTARAPAVLLAAQPDGYGHVCTCHLFTCTWVVVRQVFANWTKAPLLISEFIFECRNKVGCRYFKNVRRYLHGVLPSD